MSTVDSFVGTVVSHHHSPSNGDESQAKSLQNKKAPENPHYEYLKDQSHFNSIRDSVKDDIFDMNPRPERAQSLVYNTDHFISHASTLNDSIQKFVSGGGNKNDLKWVYRHGAEELRRSYTAFEENLQAVKAALVDKSEEETISKIKDLSDFGDNLFKAMLVRLGHRDGTEKHGDYRLNAMEKKSDRGEADTSVAGTEGEEGSEGRGTAGWKS